MRSTAWSPLIGSGSRSAAGSGSEAVRLHVYASSEAGADEDVLQRAAEPLLGGQVTGDEATERHRVRHPVEHDAGDLLDEVDLSRDVARPPRRDGHGPGTVHLEAEPLEDRALLARGDVEADQAARALRAEGHEGSFRETVVDVDRGDRLGGGEVDEQAAGERRSRLGRVRVDALLPLVRPLRAEPEPLGGAEDADRLEVRRLEEQLGRRLGDLRLEASHDRRERNGTLAVGDQQVARPELAERAVERAERLAFAGAPHEDPRRPREARGRTRGAGCPTHA